jgi:hypothetical protein
LVFALSPRLPPIDMAPPQAITVVDSLPWSRSIVTRFALSELVNGGQLAPNVDGQPQRGSSHQRWTGSPTRRSATSSASSATTSGLCYHYGVELHNFALNAISQAATFVGVCEGFLGIPVNWDL